MVLLVTLTIAGSWSYQTSAFIAPASTMAATSHSRHTSSSTRSHACSHQASSSSYARRRAAAAAAGALRMSTAEAPEVPVATAEATDAQAPAVGDIPTNLPSEAGIDYVPLATMLATGDLKGADQFTRDALIRAAGAGSQKRDFVYWTEVKKIPKYVECTLV